MEDKEINILHLTDLHFGAETNHKVSQTALANREITLNSLLATFRTIDKTWQPQIIAVSGDIGWSCSYNNYEQAHVWLNKVREIFKIDPSHIIFCPGNHDIDLSETDGMYRPSSVEQAEKVLCIEKIQKFDRLFQNFIKASTELFSLPKLENGHETGSYLFGVRIIEGVRFLVLNSSWYSRDGDDLQKLYLGLPLIKFLFSKNLIIDKLNHDDEYMTVGLVHHPLNSEWYHFNETISAIDRISPFDFLMDKCSIFLTGHKHGNLQRPDYLRNSLYQVNGGATYDNDSYVNNCTIIKINIKTKYFQRLGIEYSPRISNWEIKEDGEIYNTLSEKKTIQEKLMIPKALKGFDAIKPNIAKEQISVYEKITCFFPKTYQKVIVDAIENKNAICGFLSSSPKDYGDVKTKFDAYSRYHLGHYYFVKLIDTLIELNPDSSDNICILNCPSSKNSIDITDFKKMQMDINWIWNDCFKYKTKFVEISNFIYTIGIGNAKERNFQKAQTWLTDKETKLSRLSNHACNSLEKWRNESCIDSKAELAFIDKETKDDLFKTLDIKEINLINRRYPISLNEVIALCYTLRFKPKWYEIGWFLKTIKTLNTKDDNNIQSRILNVNTITIIESLKNMPTWESMSFVSKYFGLGDFPQRAYFNVIPQIGIDRPMKTNRPDEAIFLHQDIKEIIKNRKEDDFKEILGHFTLDENNILWEEKLKRLVQNGRERLKQVKEI